MCFDVGHAHITGALGALEAALPHVALFHVHDNLGDRRDGASAPATVDPLTPRPPPAARHRDACPGSSSRRMLAGRPAPLHDGDPRRRTGRARSALGKVTAELLAGAASAGCAA